jgi:hypothetical protein
MFKAKKNKAADVVKTVRKSPIVFVPDPSYVDAEGNLIPTTVRVCASAPLYRKVEGVLEVLDQNLTEVKNAVPDDVQTDTQV